MPPRGFLFALAALGLLAGACGSLPGSPGGRVGESSTPAPVALAQAAPSPKEPLPSALRDPRDPAFPAPLVDLDEIVPGGPPPDGIPAVDRPLFHRAGEVEWLEDREAVLALALGDDSRAYPVQVLMWHEIVNDTVDGVPVAVTYCPLCNSAIAFDRRLGPRVLDFGTSGMLYNSALVMYDRQTESLWSHFTGEAVAGALAGSRLDSFPVSTVSWGDWRRRNPEGWVLSRETGFRRDYGRNPYRGYDEPASEPFLFEGEPDRRMPAKTRVVGLRAGGESVAVVLDGLLRRRVIHLAFGGRPVVVWAKPGTASSLDGGRVADGRDVGATGAFEAVLEGRELRFEPAGEGFRDRETGSEWDVLGRAAAGPLAGRALVPVGHVDTFWFAWAAFQPETRLVR